MASEASLVMVTAWFAGRRTEVSGSDERRAAGCR
jgi:hypothetical protein